MGESYGASGEHYWKNESNGHRHNSNRDWEQASARWQKCDQPPYEGRGGNWHSNSPKPRAPNTLRLQSQGSLIRSSSSGGHSETAYDSYWGSDYENHHGRMFYTKRQLLMIYDQLKTRRQLVVPFDCDLPVTLHREGVMMGYQEFAEDKWLCADPAGRVQGPVSKQEILTGKASGALSGDLGVVPLSWFREKSVTVNQLIQMWHENDVTLKENMEKQVSKNGVDPEASAEQQPAPNSTAQSCASTATTTLPSCRFDRINVLSPKLDVDNFMYIDSYGSVQGPFKKQQLLEWWKQGYLPQDLHVYPMGCEKCDCIKFRSILAKWCCDAGEWKYLPVGGNVEGPFPKSRILEWFENGLLPLNLAVRPQDWEDSISTWLQLPEVLVCWLPQSTHWHCQKRGTQDDQVISVQEVAELWESELGQENGSLLVLPDSWKGKVYFPVEVLMKAYGYLV